MENLLLLRIDDRLIHGQVMTAWLKKLPAKEIIIVDNGVAKDEFMKAVIEMAAPDKVKVAIYNEDQAIDKFLKGLTVPSIVLVKSPLILKRLMLQGVVFDNINIGGMGMSPGRKSLFKNISASDEEREVLKEFIQNKMNVKIQIIPSEKTTNVADIL